MGISIHRARTCAICREVDLRSNESANCSHRDMAAGDADKAEALEEVAVTADTKKRGSWLWRRMCQVKVDIR